MALQLSLAKPGQEKPKLSLSMKKGALFSVELFWDSNHDLDAHALLATNDGGGAKVSDFAQVLSTYNCVKTNPEGHLQGNPDGSFSTPCGALRHSGDARSGMDHDVDESITVDGAKVASGVNEIPIFVTIHPAAAPATFANVASAGIRIKDDSGKVLGEYQLSKEFAKFNAVQMGSMIYDPAKGWEYVAVGNGFNGDFNTVLGFFS